MSPGGDHPSPPSTSIDIHRAVLLGGLLTAPALTTAHATSLNFGVAAFGVFGKNDVGARLCEGQSEGATDALGGSGNDSDFILEAES